MLIYVRFVWVPCEGVRIPMELFIREAPIMLFLGCLLCQVVQAQLSSVIVDRFPALDTQVSMSPLVGKEDLIEAVLKVLEKFLFCQGICQVFGETLGLLLLLLAVIFLPDFPIPPLFPGCTVDSCIPPPGTFSPPIILVNQRTFLISFSKLDFSFPQISLVPLPLALLALVSVMRAFVTLMEPPDPWGPRP